MFSITMKFIFSPNFKDGWVRGVSKMSMGNPLQTETGPDRPKCQIHLVSHIQTLTLVSPNRHALAFVATYILEIAGPVTSYCFRP